MQACLRFIRLFMINTFIFRVTMCPKVLKINNYEENVLILLFSYCSWGSQGKNNEVVCHSLLQWTTFCQTSPPWPTNLGWPHTAWLSFIELDKAMVCVIRLASFLWLWFQCICPMMPSHNIYHLTWVSLTLDMPYLLTAALAKCSRCSLPWRRSPLLTLNLE